MGLLDDAIREHLELKRKHGASEEELTRAELEALTPARRDPAGGAGVPPVEQVPGAEPAPASGASVTDAPPTMPPAADAPPPPDLSATPAAEEPVADQPTQIRPVPQVDEPAPASTPTDVPDTGAVPLGEQQEDYLAPEPLDEGAPAHPPLESTDPIEPPDADAPEAEVAPPPGTPKPHGDPAIGERPEAAAPAYDDDEFDPDEVPADEALGSSDPPPADPYRARTSILDDPLREGPPPPEPAPEGEQDVLEETPDFLQETPEHDKLWFEQKPPRDFDFD
jgi:hypothetical protein